MSWESTIPYYRIINEKVKEMLGGLHSARIILYSVEFAEIEECQATGQWDKSADILGDAAKKLEAAGAAVEINETAGTFHGYDIAIKSKIARMNIEKRIAFLKRSSAWTIVKCC